jgi:predicted nucleic acid-binding protein
VTDRLYLDTSALVRWACGIAGSPETRDQRGKQRLEILIPGGNHVATCPVTLAEYTDVVNTLLRDQEGWKTAVDETAVDKAEAQLMAWLASDQLRIRPLGPRAFEMGMSYVAAASRDHGRKLKAWDAIHLAEAVRWARESANEVIIVTTDGDFAGFLDVFPEFKDYVRLVDPTTP